jgi:hypothetical protein
MKKAHMKVSTAFFGGIYEIISMYLLSYVLLMMIIWFRSSNTKKGFQQRLKTLFCLARRHGNVYRQYFV